MKKQSFTKTGQYDNRRAFSRKDAAEFRSGKKEFIVCPDCKNVYYKKSWHHSLNQKSNIKNQKDIRFGICPACKMAKGGRFEGQVFIENVPEDTIKEVAGLIKNFGEGLRKRDPQDRILKIIQTKDGIEVQTSENQLAKRIARRVKDTYRKKAKQIIVYSKEEDVVRIKIVFQ